MAPSAAALWPVIRQGGMGKNLSKRGTRVAKTRAEPAASSDGLTCPDAFLSPLQIDDAVERALAEDLGRAGDVTSIAIIPSDASASGVVVARRAGVIAGL